ncbi:MAG: PQQ-dependent sugar dehydrogenase [Chloroflexota bacterium]
MASSASSTRRARSPAPCSTCGGAWARTASAASMPSRSIPGSPRTASSMSTTTRPPATPAWSSIASGGRARRWPQGPVGCCSTSRARSGTTTAGWLGFGPDGYLYIASGDGGGNAPGDPFGNGQDRRDLFGSILRINVDKGSPYAIPKDNPFRKGGGRKELWNYGLRNPWRASFDRLTGDLCIGDVGQSAVEGDRHPAGREGRAQLRLVDHAGSRCHRSSSCSTKGLTMPVAEYAHGAKGCSVTGGYVYRGTESPALYGAYLFSDYCTSIIWGIDASKAKPGAKLKPAAAAQQGSSFVSFGEDDDGELYVVSIGGGVYHIVGREKG